MRFSQSQSELPQSLGPSAGDNAKEKPWRQKIENSFPNMSSVPGNWVFATCCRYLGMDLWLCQAHTLLFLSSRRPRRLSINFPTFSLPHSSHLALSCPHRVIAHGRLELAPQSSSGHVNFEPVASAAGGVVTSGPTSWMSFAVDHAPKIVTHTLSPDQRSVMAFTCQGSWNVKKGDCFIINFS